ncbi:MAG: flagellar basal body L-ring protein FlgH [Bacillota bacterium]|nr:flagellar basal body L-ring protein FlgH [Bacillota bacterium]HOB91511.1 flagellar basal body L-ring protein FlgH [Bacillota bacterium]HPZ54665.1 flagellar basal body L-ring protein FlgH [Bacillota bacterium]HQD18899.1 flagellar basal body L-ring protein FlgH [Bacillota bacterium]
MVNRRNVRGAIAVVAAVLFGLACVCSAQSLYSADGAMGTSLFADVKARDVGDIVTIVVYENARASSSTSKTTGKSAEAGLDAGTGLLSFIPSAGFGVESGSSGSERLSQTGTLTATITARIVEKLDNGFFRIEGRRTVTVNGEQQVLVVSGVIRDRDISASNTIPSTLVADAEISFSGQPQLRQSGGFLSTLWDGLLGIIKWVF